VPRGQLGACVWRAVAERCLDLCHDRAGDIWGRRVDRFTAKCARIRSWCVRVRIASRTCVSRLLALGP
jgi:hypothetical protein